MLARIKRGQILNAVCRGSYLLIRITPRDVLISDCTTSSPTRAMRRADAPPSVLALPQSVEDVDHRRPADRHRPNRHIQSCRRTRIDGPDRSSDPQPTQRLPRASRRKHRKAWSGPGHGASSGNFPLQMAQARQCSLLRKVATLARLHPSKIAVIGPSSARNPGRDRNLRSRANHRNPRKKRGGQEVLSLTRGQAFTDGIRHRVPNQAFKFFGYPENCINLPSR
jgi:hypothetical protein